MDPFLKWFILIGAICGYISFFYICANRHRWMKDGE